LGYYGVYVIMATTREHIKAGIDFARRNNIRLIIRNTGHDFEGRSTGFGALVINTHSFQKVEWINKYNGAGSYRGSAVKIGAGVQGKTILAQGHARSPPVVIVTGECPTVGIAGGFIQGGGHGPWTTLKGFCKSDLATQALLALPRTAELTPRDKLPTMPSPSRSSLPPASTSTLTSVRTPTSSGRSRAAARPRSP